MRKLKRLALAIIVCVLLVAPTQRPAHALAMSTAIAISVGLIGAAYFVPMTIAIIDGAKSVGRWP